MRHTFQNDNSIVQRTRRLYWMEKTLLVSYLTTRLWHKSRAFFQRYQQCRYSSPINASQVRGRDGSAAILAAKRSAGVAPEVNLREHVTHTPLPSTNKAAHSCFKTQRRCHQNSKTGVSVAPQKGLMSSKIFLKNKNNVGFQFTS